MWRSSNWVGAIVVVAMSAWSAAAWADWPKLGFRSGQYSQGVRVATAPVVAGSPPFVVVSSPMVAAVPVSVSPPPLATFPYPLSRDGAQTATAPVVWVVPAVTIATPVAGTGSGAEVDSGLPLPTLPAPEVPIVAEPGALLEANPEALAAIRVLIQERMQSLSAADEDEVTIVVSVIGEASQAYAERAGVDVAMLDAPEREPDRATLRRLITQAAAELSQAETTTVPSQPTNIGTSQPADTHSTASVWMIPGATVSTATPTLVPAVAYPVLPVVVPRQPWWRHSAR